MANTTPTPASAPAAAASAVSSAVATAESSLWHRAMAALAAHPKTCVVVSLAAGAAAMFVIEHVL